MRLISFFGFMFLLGLASTGAIAAGETEFSGNPTVLPSGVIMIEGHDVTLWGIDALANDQKCWHDERAWDCGDEALTVLRHFLTGHPARCVVKIDLGNGKASAQCFRKKSGKETDIAQYLVKQGWARDRQADSGGLYAPDQEEARLDRRGIWTSKFQTAEDWKSGAPNYVVYQIAPPRTPGAGDAAKEAQ